VAQGKFLFTSESVSMGHPDKLADQISDGILDALFAKDPMSRVACETMVTTGIAIVAGEITTKAVIDYPAVVRQVIREVDRPVNVLALDGVPAVAELAEAGVSRISVGGSFAFAALEALVSAATELREQGTYGFRAASAAGAAAARRAFS